MGYRASSEAKRRTNDEESIPSGKPTQSKRGSRSSVSYNSPWTTNSRKTNRYEKSPTIGGKGLMKK